MYTKTLFTSLVVLCLTISAYAKERPKIRVYRDDQTTLVCEFSKYDRTRFQFEFKTKDSKSTIRLSQLAAIGFDTMDLALPPASLSANTDEVVFRSGVSQSLLFTHMEKDKAQFGLEITKTKQEFNIDSIRFIRFNHEILNIDRHNYGCDLNFLDEGSVEEMATMAVQEIEGSSEVITDTLIQRYLDSLTNHLARFAKGNRAQYTTRLLNSDEINAFTPGGGNIYLLRGLVERMNTESELAGVIAHEMGHNIGNHIAQQYSKQLMYAGILGAAGAILNSDKNEWAKTLTDAGGILTYFTAMKYGREEERQADLLGCYNLYGADIHPKGMITLFETFSKLGGRTDNVIEQWAMSHPDPDERRDNIAAELAELDADGMAETSDYFNRVKQYVTALPPPKYVLTVFTDTARIAAGSYLYLLLPIPAEGMKNAMLQGQFAAQGGMKNDIVFHIFDEINFINWSNGNQATSLLSTEQLTVSEVNFTFPKPGKYYLVFDNRHAWLAEKMIAAKLFVQYTKR